MNNMITITQSEYNSLVEAREMLEDIQAFDAADPSEEGFPHEFMKRLIAGENPLKVHREWRGLSKLGLEKISGVNRIQIGDIESGKSKGSIDTAKKLASALNVTIDDIT